MLVDRAGMVTLPMTFLNGTPLDCTIHPALWAAAKNHTFENLPFPADSVKDMVASGGASVTNRPVIIEMLSAISVRLRALPSLLRQEVLHRDARLSLPPLLPLQPLPRPAHHGLHGKALHQARDARSTEVVAGNHDHVILLSFRAYNSDVKMEQLWDMLLKSSLEREDVATLEQVDNDDDDDEELD